MKSLLNPQNNSTIKKLNLDNKKLLERSNLMYLVIPKCELFESIYYELLTSKSISKENIKLLKEMDNELNKK